jgi:mono/diheme cytochrome c family protein
VDNVREHESIISLGPWYLIWENIGKPELLEKGSYGWPYQVNQVQLQTKSEFEQLAPGADDAELTAGYSSFRTYCLSCHLLNGVGGSKYGLDLELAQCRLDDTTLIQWILRPEAYKPGTTMPALNPMLSDTLRERTAMQIVAYLRTRQKCP